jgi:hypothetical protein
MAGERQHRLTCRTGWTAWVAAVVVAPLAAQPPAGTAPSSSPHILSPALVTSPDFTGGFLTGDIQQAGCAGCGGGGGLLGPPGMPGLGGPGCCEGGACVFGQKPCAPCEGRTLLGRFLCGVYHCLCCPDPCYDPRWIPLADAAFFTEAVRPQTQQRLRWDAGLDLRLPDRAEFFWSRNDGRGRGPAPPLPLRAESALRYHELSLYTEIATSRLSLFVDIPYRSLRPDHVPGAVGFADMNLGTKSLLFDCELFQIAFQFRTYLPAGNFFKGLGNGHVSLEPSLLVGLRVGPDTFFQGQLAEWIPLGGDPGYQGAVLHYHASLNQVLCRPLPDVPLIGTLEFNGWSFQAGSYTDPVLGTQSANGTAYLSAGPGLRLVVCDRIDFGVGTSFALTEPHFAGQLFRSEFRWRY